MNTSGIYGMGINTYAYTNNNRKTTETGNFIDEVQKAAESRSTQTKSNSSAWAGETFADFLADFSSNSPVPPLSVPALFSQLLFPAPLIIPPFSHGVSPTKIFHHLQKVKNWNCLQVFPPHSIVPAKPR